jgi:hypothetical protein
MLVSDDGQASPCKAFEPNGGSNYEAQGPFVSKPQRKNKLRRVTSDLIVSAGQTPSDRWGVRLRLRLRLLVEPLYANTPIRQTRLQSVSGISRRELAAQVRNTEQSVCLAVKIAKESAHHTAHPSKGVKFLGFQPAHGPSPSWFFLARPTGTLQAPLCQNHLFPTALLLAHPCNCLAGF